MEFINAFETNKTVPVKRTIADDYRLCQKKLQDAFVNVNGVLGLVINEDYALSFKRPKSYQVYNPFHKFFIIRKDGGFKEFAKAQDCNKTHLASVSEDKLNYGKLVELGESFGKVDFNLVKNSLVITPCCQVLGVSVGKKKFLTNLELEKLTYRKSPYDGYIGAIFYQKGKKVFVKDVDFNLKNIHFCPRDEIVSIDGVKIKSLKQLKAIVLSAEYGDFVEVVLKRSGKIKTKKIKILHKPRYNINSSAYLQKLGVMFDNNLVAKKVYKNSLIAKKGLLKGDKLIQINFKNVKNLNEAKNRFLYNKKSEFQLLFTRNDFQFFIKFSTKDIKGGLVALGFCPAI